jgi:hypothetical protein
LAICAQSSTYFRDRVFAKEDAFREMLNGPSMIRCQTACHSPLTQARGHVGRARPAAITIDGERRIGTKIRLFIAHLPDSTSK